MILVSLTSAQKTANSARIESGVGPIASIDCSRFSLPVWIVNEVDVLAAIAVPLRWSSSQIVYDSIRWQGSRVDHWEVNLVIAKYSNSTLLIGATRFEAAPASPDSGLLCQIFFHNQGLSEGSNVCFDTTFIAPGGEFVFLISKRAHRTQAIKHTALTLSLSVQE